MTFLSLTRRKSTDEHVPDLARSSSEETPMSSNPSIDDSLESFHSTVSSDTHLPAPATPEGLRPRQSLHELGRSLGVPTLLLQELDRLEPSLQPKTAAYLPVASALPCIRPRYEYSSPVLSRTSFYSRESSSTMVAESPNLHPGHTLTAVGALLATKSISAAQNIKNRSTPILPPLTLGVLPPRTWLDDPEDDACSETQSVGYHQLNDSVDIISPNRVRFLDQVNSPGSHTTTSFPVSPVRRVLPASGVNMSFSSQLGLVEFGKGMHLYNFDPIIVAGDQLTNVSAISQSMVDDNSYQSIKSLESVKHSYTTKNMPNHIYHHMDAELKQRKYENQRHAKEQLLLDAVTRLQSDLTLVEEVELMHDDNDGVAHWFLKTNLEEEGLLTGFNVAKRHSLLKYFQSLLLEMDTVQPEEFFLSPTQMQGYGETHDDLRLSILFMIHLVKASPCTTTQRWVCHSELRAAMGIPVKSGNEPIRGGDSSLFSLPSESTTPHTSNLSMTSTITTHHSPNRRSKEHMEVQASAIRRLTEIMATILQKLTLACNNIFSKHDVVRAMEDVKRNYMQLISLNRIDLTTFVDAFVIDESDGDAPPSPNIVRQVSNDDHEHPFLDNYLRESSRQLMSNFGHGTTTQIQVKDSMFSPNSEDMRTVTVVVEDDDENNCDDLRRTVGSNDYEGGDMERDGPEERERECCWEEGPVQNVHCSVCH